MDFIKNDSLVERKRVKCMLADKYGNWKDAGFGTDYQHASYIKTGVPAADITKIIVWQGLDANPVTEITKVGIIVTRTGH